MSCLHTFMKKGMRLDCGSDKVAYLATMLKWEGQYYSEPPALTTIKYLGKREGKISPKLFLPHRWPGWSVEMIRGG
jgi:hypothetical protein